MYACYETSLPLRLQESEVNFARIQTRTPSTSARDPNLGFQFASHDKRVSHWWSKTTYTEEGIAVAVA